MDAARSANYSLIQVALNTAQQITWVRANYFRVNEISWISTTWKKHVLGWRSVSRRSKSNEEKLSVLQRKLMKTARSVGHFSKVSCSREPKLTQLSVWVVVYRGSGGALVSGCTLHAVEAGLDNACSPWLTVICLYVLILIDGVTDEFISNACADRRKTDSWRRLFIIRQLNTRCTHVPRSTTSFAVESTRSCVCPSVWIEYSLRAEGGERWRDGSYRLRLHSNNYSTVAH